MHITRDHLFTIITDVDLHDRTFRASHYHGNDHLDLTLPLSSHHHRTIHLCGAQCRQLGLQLLALAESFPLSDPRIPHDYSI